MNEVKDATANNMSRTKRAYGRVYGLQVFPDAPPSQRWSGVNVRASVALPPSPDSPALLFFGAAHSAPSASVFSRSDCGAPKRH